MCGRVVYLHVAFPCHIAKVCEKFGYLERIFVNEPWFYDCVLLLDCYTQLRWESKTKEKKIIGFAPHLRFYCQSQLTCVCVFPGTLTEKSKFEDSEVSMVEMNSKLEHALTAKQEAEAKVAGLENKVKQYEEELTTLKKQVGWPLSLFWLKTKE